MNDLPSVFGSDQQLEPFDAAELSKLCLGVVDDLEIAEFWKEWKGKWDSAIVTWNTAHEKAALEAARDVRRRWKGRTIQPEDLETEIQAAATAAKAAISEPVTIDDIPDAFSTQLLQNRAENLKNAKVRLSDFEEMMRARSQKDDQDALDLATVAAAKAKMLGRPSNHVKKLRLPVKDFQALESGIGIRKGITHAAGGIVEVLRQIRVASGAISLRSRGVDDEWVEQIAAALAQPWSRPTALDLSSNRITSSGCAWLSLGLAGCTTLTSLNLSGNRIDRDGLDHLADGLLLNTTITSLSLGSNKFGEENLAVAAERAGNADNARRGGGWDDRPGEAVARDPPPPAAVAQYASGLGRFLDLLTFTAALRTLDLGGNRIGPELFGLLCDVLTLNETLRRLDVSGNALGADGGGHLGRLLACNQRLQWVDAGSNGLGPDGADYLARQLEPNSALTDLRLASNRFGPRGAAWVARAVAQAAALVALDLDSNEIDAAGGGAVAAAVRDAPLSRLTALQLSRNPLGDRGAARVAQALAGHFRLRRLGLAHCELTAAGAAAVGALAASLGGLRRLDLGANRIPSAGVELLCRWALAGGARLPGLEEVVLDGNLIDDAAAPALAALAARRPGLRRLRVCGNFLSPAGATALARCGRECAHVLELALAGNDLEPPPPPPSAWAPTKASPAEADAGTAAAAAAQKAAAAAAAAEIRELERLLRRRRAGEAV